MSSPLAASTSDDRRRRIRRLIVLGGMLVTITALLAYERSCMSRFDRLVETTEARIAGPLPPTSAELARDLLERTGTDPATSEPSRDTYVVTGGVFRQTLTVTYVDNGHGLRAGSTQTKLGLRFWSDHFNDSVFRHMVVEDVDLHLLRLVMLVPPFAFFVLTDRGRKLLRAVQSALTPNFDSGKAPRSVPLLLGIAVFVLLASRRWCQLRSPQVWCEDGTVFLPEFMEHGWSAIVRPVAGYLTLVPRFVSAVSVEASLLRYPEISTALSVAFEVFVVLCVAYAPTMLRARSACAVATVLVPCDPETIFLPSYTQWWTAVLIYLAALWERNSPRWGWRLAFLLLGGLSSPVVPVIVPVLVLRSLADRRSWREHVCTLTGTAAAVVQLYFVLSSGNFDLSSGNSGVGVLGTAAMRMLVDSVPVFFGQFLTGNLTDTLVLQWPAGLALVSLFATSIVSRRGEQNRACATILYLCVGTIFLTAMRIDIFQIKPQIAPRYLLLPFVLWMWLLVQTFVTASRSCKSVMRAVVACAALGAFANAMPVWQRCHDDHEWRLHVYSCQLFPDYRVPVAYAGDAEDCWWTSFSQVDVARRLARDPFFDAAAVPVFPYSIESAPESAFRPSPVNVIRDSDADVVGVYSPYVSPFVPADLFGTRNADGTGWGTRTIRVRMRKGDRVGVLVGERKSQRFVVEGLESRFHSILPHAEGWRQLTFDSDRLPAEFVLRIEDQGDNPDGWTVVAAGIEGVDVAPGGINE